MNKRRDTSLVGFIIESIDDTLPAGSPLNGHAIYMRGYERFERYHLEQRLARERRVLEPQLPLPAPTIR